MNCHESIHQKWQKTAHAIEFKEDTAPASHDGHCGRCHMTGEKENCVGCEACHGPSGTHALNPESSIRPECVVCDMQRQCIRCHTRSISPTFRFKSALKKVNHAS